MSALTPDHCMHTHAHTHGPHCDSCTFQRSVDGLVQNFSHCCIIHCAGGPGPPPPGPPPPANRGNTKVVSPNNHKNDNAHLLCRQYGSDGCYLRIRSNSIPCLCIRTWSQRRVHLQRRTRSSQDTHGGRCVRTRDMRVCRRLSHPYT